MTASAPASARGALSPGSSSPQTLQSTRGSEKDERWPEAFQTSECIMIEASRPTMSSRLWTITRHQSFIRLRFSSTPIGP